MMSRVHTGIPIRRSLRFLPSAAFLVLVIVQCVIAASASAAGDRAPRVINGTVVPPATYATRYPWIVSLQFRHDPKPPAATDGHFCGGSLIAPDKVLTAAHCVSGIDVASGKELDVLIGRRDLAGSAGTRVHVTEVYPDPLYDGSGLGEHDSAVLQLAAPVAGVTPVGIVQPADAAAWGNGAGMPTGAGGPFVAGWGIRWTDPLFGPDAGYVIGSELRDVAIPIIADTECADGGAAGGTGWGRLFDSTTMMCAGRLATVDPQFGGQSDGLTPCFGDSGGPLVVDAGGGTYKQAGIVSFGPQSCTSRDLPPVFTRVDGERTFIEGAHTSPPRKTETRPVRVVGDPVVGSPLTCDAGSWSGPGISFTYEWYRNQSSGDPVQDFANQIDLSLRAQIRRSVAGRRFTADEAAGFFGLDRIAGATSSTYVPVVADRGSSVACSVTATNAGWSTWDFSDTTEPVVQLGLGGSATTVVPRLRKAACSGEECSILVRLTGKGTASIVRVGGFAVHGPHTLILDAFATDESGRNWRLDHVRAHGPWKSYVMAWDDTGHKSQVLVTRYNG